MTRFLYRLATWSAAHAWLVIAAWLVVLVSLTAADRILPPPGQQEFSLGGTDSAAALTLVSRAFPGSSSDANPLVIGSDERLDQGPGLRTVEDVESAVRGVQGVAEVTGPQDEPDLYSSDKKIAQIQVVVSDQYVGEPSIAQEILDAAQKAAPNDQVALGGLLGNSISQPSTQRSERLGLLAAVIVLMLALRRVWAAAIPLFNAIITVGVGIAIIDLLSRVVLIPSIAPVLGTMLGLGVGIDYALFLVTRHRAMLVKGFEVHDAAGRTAGTSGAGIVFAGSTLVLALAGLTLTGIPFLAWMGYAAAIVVAIAVFASATLVPAILGLLGHRVMRKKHAHIRHENDDHLDHGMWARIADAVTTKPWPFTIGATVLLLVMAAPMLTMSFGQTDASALPPSTTAYQANELLTEGFGPGSTGPLAVVSQLNQPATAPQDVDVPSGTDPRTLDPRLTDLSKALADTAGVSSVSAPVVSPDGGVSIISVTPTTGPADPATQVLVDTLRDDVLVVADTGSAMESHVGGGTALFMDLTDVIGERLPYFIIGVATLSGLLLMVAYRSLVIPVKAAAMNLLSICAAYGVVVVVFEWGWGASLIGLDELVPIETFVPMMMFAVLFGLSMDYEVFLLTGFREHWDKTGDMTTAVRRGLTDTGQVVTSAATIMVVVFASFILVDDAVTKMFGVGLATAVLVDATIVRCLLVPALMVLAAKWTWWLPHWLDRLLPQLHVEGDPDSLDSIDRPEPEPKRTLADAVRPATGLGFVVAGVLFAWFVGSRMNAESSEHPFQAVAIAVSAVVGGLIVWLPRAAVGSGPVPGIRVLVMLCGGAVVALVFLILTSAIPFTSQNPGLFVAWGLLFTALIVAATRVKRYGLPFLLGGVVMAVTLGVGAGELDTNVGVLLRNALLPAALAAMFSLFLSRTFGVVGELRAESAQQDGEPGRGQDTSGVAQEETPQVEPPEQGPSTVGVSGGDRP